MKKYLFEVGQQLADVFYNQENIKPLNQSKMEKEFVPYELALRMKQLGFDEPCMASRDMGNNHGLIQVPTWQSAFRWFREKYELHSTITSISQESWQWHITKPGESLGKLYDEDFYTYEEAELACIEKLIEIVELKLE
jgi:hypothetical protein